MAVVSPTTSGVSVMVPETCSVLSVLVDASFSALVLLESPQAESRNAALQAISGILVDFIFNTPFWL
jgi:hypothetical protein